jgi:hypothetical protein
VSGVAAALSAPEVEPFDKVHEKLLSELADEHFSVLHRINAHFLEPI